ncbi:MAG: glucose-6-phosphate isomerase [Legionella sp.]|nr:glucose-6-phosphate isomerase [Legionella sp.]
MIHMDAWKALEKKALSFSYHQNNTQYPVLSNSNITLDYNAQRLSADTRESLFQLAKDCELKQKINHLFSGHPVNATENRPALHWALRAKSDAKHNLGDANIMPQIQETLRTMHDISNQIRNQTWLGYSKKPITDVVNLGIGGSHLGPFFCLHALADLKSPKLNYHFISDFDPDAFTRATQHLNPETTLFIASSKSFTTAETLYNLKQAITWINKPHALKQHFIAVTASPEKAAAFGIQHILPIWDWVGGRYSVCSAINLITCIAIGFEAFTELLHGAASMDAHFCDAPFEENLPVHLALLGIWTNNFLNIHQLLLLTYGQNLDYFTAYIQQLDMESNGKTINQLGKAVNYATGPIVWGGSGNQAQHSYYQLLSQGTHYIAADLISVEAHQKSAIHQLCLAQKTALSTPADSEQNNAAFIREHTAINYLSLKNTNPNTIGALIALYEHKIYVQSVIWHINPFDQPGVESSKRLMQRDFSNA